MTWSWITAQGDIQIETGSFIIFVSVLLAIPLFLGRALYRGLVTRRRIESEMHDLTHASARVIGFTTKTSHSESDVFEHFAIVEYETPEHEVVWAETQPVTPRQAYLLMTTSALRDWRDVLVADFSFRDGGDASSN